MPPTSSPDKSGTAEELAARKAAERERIAAGDIPDIVPPPLAKGKTEADPSIFHKWIRSQPLCVADRPERKGMPYAITLLIGKHFTGYGLDHIHQWANLCDPPWPAGYVQKEMERARHEINLEKHRQELAQEAMAWEEKYEISRGKYYDEEWFDCYDRPSWIVEGLLIKLHAALYAGPIKTLKTSTLLDLLVSYASGTPFLGRFKVPEPNPALMFCGENNEQHISRLVRLIAKARGLEITDLPIQLAYKMPNLGDPKALEQLSTIIRHRKIKLVIFDPLYLAFPGIGSSAANVFDMGERYRNAAAACLDCFATPIFSTHSTKDLSPGKLMVLSDIIFAGGGEFARQWCLFNRQEEYDPRQPGEHSLSMSYGGAAGHSGVLSLDISEGELSPDFSGRKWEVTVSPYGEEPPGRDAGNKTTRKDTSKDARKPEQRVLDALADLAPKHGGRVPRKVLSDAANVSGSNLTTVLKRLEGEGKVSIETEEYEYMGKPSKRYFVLQSTPKG